MEETSDKGDLYAKRLLDRQRENRSPDCYSKSLRRRLSIMEAIYKSSISPPAESNFGGNPFEKEFSMSSLRNDNSGGPTAPTTSSWTQGSSSAGTSDVARTYRVDVSPTLTDCSTETQKSGDYFGPTDSNNKDFDNRRSRQFHHEFLAEVPEERESERGSRNSERRDSLYMPESRLSRMSMGEYFGGPSHLDMSARNFLDKMCSNDPEQIQSDGRKSSTGPDLLFGARVLEIIEPEIVDVQRKSTGVYSQRRTSEISNLQKKFAEMNSEPFDSTATTSYISEDIRDLEQEIENMEFHPEVEERLESRASTRKTTPRRQEEPPAKSTQMIAETPKRLYPDLELRRMSEKLATRKLFHSNDVGNSEHLGTAAYPNHEEIYANEEIKRNDSEKPMTPERDSLFKTANTTPPTQRKDQENIHNRPHPSSSSFIKRNMSFVVGHLPKLGRHHNKPNLESTRKPGHNQNKSTSPFSQSSMISTLTLPNSPPIYADMGQQSQPQGANIHTERMERSLPFEVENFLEMALGDEQYNSTVTFDHPDMRDRTNSQLNASELLSQERTPLMAKFSRVAKVPMSEPPKHSNSLNRTLSLYKTLTQRIKKKFRGSIKDEIRPLEKPVLPADLNALDESVKRLLTTVDVQLTYIYQASKALDLCASMPEFSGSRERVESERQLLLATLRKAAAVEEIRRLASQRSEDQPCSERAEVKLGALSLQLREEILRRERQSGSVIDWYVMVISEGPFVWATEAVPIPENVSRLYFGGELAIPHLTPNFRIVLRIYSLQLQQVVYNHEEKYHIPTKRDDLDMASTTCPSPNKLLRRASIKRRSLMSTRQFDIRFSGIRESSFSLCGTVQLTLHDLNLSPPWPLIGVPQRSVLQGTVDLNLTHRLHLTASHTGFLTFGEMMAGHAVWNRRWCVLENHHLLFWNYAVDQGNKDPVGVIDLSRCVTPRIGLIDRSLCAKPRTLLIETSRPRDAVDRDSFIIENRTSRAVVRNLLSFDNNQDLMDWQTKLNYVVGALREWNMIMN